jgi:uncharacterized protein YjbI with pentapeptide repeats
MEGSAMATRTWISVHSGFSEQDGFHPLWSDERGDPLSMIPFEIETDFSFSDGEEPVHVPHDLSGYLFSAQSLEDSDFSGSLLRRADFRFAQLRMADFTGSDLTEANFSHADLTFADFTSAKLNEVDFSNTDLCKACFRSAMLNGTNFEGADLEQAVFTESDLRGCDFLGADLRATCLAGAIFDESTQLPFTTQEGTERGMLYRPKGRAS